MVLLNDIEIKMSKIKMSKVKMSKIKISKNKNLESKCRKVEYEYVSGLEISV